MELKVVKVIYLLTSKLPNQ